MAGVCFCLLLSSSDESLSEDESFFLFLLRLAGGGTAAFATVGVAVARGERNGMRNVRSNNGYSPLDWSAVFGFGFSSSSESVVLLEAADFLAGCWTGLAAVGVALTGNFFCLSSSDESLSEEESFFFVLATVAEDGAAGLCTGVAAAAR